MPSYLIVPCVIASLRALLLNRVAPSDPQRAARLPRHNSDPLRCPGAVTRQRGRGCVHRCADHGDHVSSNRPAASPRINAAPSSTAPCGDHRRRIAFDSTVTIRHHDRRWRSMPVPCRAPSADAFAPTGHMPRLPKSPPPATAPPASVRLRGLAAVAVESRIGPRRRSFQHGESASFSQEEGVPGLGPSR